MGVRGRSPLYVIRNCSFVVYGTKSKTFFCAGCAKLAAPSKIVPFRPNRLYYLGAARRRRFLWTEFSHVFENLFIVDLLLRWCFVVLLLHDFLFVVVLVPIRRMASLKVTSDQAQQNLARKVAKLSRSIRSIAPERKISINTYGFTNVN